jgi:formylglycine-generating enzyme required for sulfatase activity
MGRKLSVLVACLGAFACAPVPHFRDTVVGAEMVFVKGGCFEMGSAPGAAGGPEEKPAHEVCVNDFYIGKYEVTQGQWVALMGNNPSANAQCGDTCPVETVSWNDAQDFIAKLNARATGGEVPAGQYRLPTEAEWEYAARSGGKAEKYSGRSDDVASIAWYAWDAGGKGTHPVGTKAPNGLGVCDMTGNVWEWTGDWYDATYYSRSPRMNPTGPESGDRRVARGGGYGTDLFDLRTSYRNFLPPEYRSSAKGFRLARTVGKPRK